MLTIQPFENQAQENVRLFVLSIQNDEFKLGFTEQEQPDLMDTETYYSTGGFWIARFNGELVGTIGLQGLDGQNGVLRKMFVKKERRGEQPGIAQLLFDTLLQRANAMGFKTIWLDTPAVAVASHKFYERNGFREVNRNDIPTTYTFPDRNSKVYKLAVRP